MLCLPSCVRLRFLAAPPATHPCAGRPHTTSARSAGAVSGVCRAACMHACMYGAYCAYSCGAASAALHFRRVTGGGREPLRQSHVAFLKRVCSSRACCTQHPVVHWQLRWCMPCVECRTACGIIRSPLMVWSTRTPVGRLNRRKGRNGRMKASQHHQSKFRLMHLSQAAGHLPASHLPRTTRSPLTSISSSSSITDTQAMPAC